MAEGRDENRRNRRGIILGETGPVRAVKDLNRKARADTVKAVTDVEWRDRQGSKLEKPSPKNDGAKLVISKAPEYIFDDDGDVVGVDAWVQLFDARGRELPIDPHRRIINPPTVPRAGVRVIGEGDQQVRELTADPLAAFWEAVWDSVEGVPNEAGWRTRGTVTTVFAGTSDGFLNSSDLVINYSAARAGNNLSTGLGFDLQIDQFNNASSIFIRQSYMEFDTSAITDSDIVTDVLLDMWLTTDNSAQDFTVEAREYDWGGGTLTTADWVPGNSLAGLTLMASIATSGIGATGAYKTFTSTGSFISATNLKTGTVFLNLSSSRFRTANAPVSGTQEGVNFQDADNSGTTQDPKLTITHAAASLAPPPFYSRPNRIWRLG